MTKTPKRPRDPNQLAKMMIDIATGEAIEEQVVQPSNIIPGRPGGLKGGKARAQKLTDTERSDIARKAAISRWKSKV